MPPTPIQLNNESLQLVDGLHRRQKDLVEYQIPRLRDCTGPLSTQQQLANELREDLDAFTRNIDALELHAEDTLKKADRAAVKEIADEFRGASIRIRKEMRTAMLQSKKAIDARASSNREELFRGATPDLRNVEEKATDDVLMKTSNNVTEALRRTLGIMHGELERSVLSHQMLEQSNATLRATSAQHDMLATATRTSKLLIRALEQADWLDRLLVFAALAFFILVILFIAKQRILDRGLRVAFWWTRFLPGPVLRGGPVGSAKGVLADVAENMKAASSSASQSHGSLAETATRIMTEALSSAPAVIDVSSESTTTAESILSSITTALSEPMSSVAGTVVEHVDL